MSKRARWAIAALFLLILLFVLWPRTRNATTTTANPNEQARQSGPPPPPNLPPSRPVTKPIALQGTAPLRPIIDEIKLEKTEVCEGEENLVSIRAHTPENKEDTYLHYAIGGETGARIPIIGTRNERVMSSYKVSVFGRNNVATVVDLPRFTVKDCKVSHRLIIEHRVNPNTEAEFSFTAFLRDPPGTAAYKPIRYLWDFGDGNTVETQSPVAEHDFTSRPQNSLYAQLLIRCTAVDAAGEQVSGRDSLQLLNADWESFAYKGLVQLHFTMTPRFPTMGSDGVVTQSVRIWHNAPAAVEIDKIMLLRQVENSESPPLEEVSVSRFLGGTSIPPSGIEVVASLDTHAEENVFGRTWQLSGWSQDGYPVQGAFTVLKPTATPTKENSNPVMDPMLKAKILKARELTGKLYVTDEDLWRLEREGAFVGLAPAPITGPPPNMPPPPKAIIDEENEELAKRRSPAKPPTTPPPPAQPSESVPGR